MENNIPKGIYCYDENGTCPYYEEVGTLYFSNKPEKKELLCDIFSECTKDDPTTRCVCPTKVIRCRYLDFTDFEEKTLLWDKVKECGINDD